MLNYKTKFRGWALFALLFSCFLVPHHSRPFASFVLAIVGLGTVAEWSDVKKVNKLLRPGYFLCVAMASASAIWSLHDMLVSKDFQTSPVATLIKAISNYF